MADNTGSQNIQTVGLIGEKPDIIKKAKKPRYIVPDSITKGFINHISTKKYEDKPRDEYTENEQISTPFPYTPFSSEVFPSASKKNGECVAVGYSATSSGYFGSKTTEEAKDVEERSVSDMLMAGYMDQSNGNNVNEKVDKKDDNTVTEKMQMDSMILSPKRADSDIDFEWNGSHLGTYKKNIIDWKLETKRAKYCQLNINGKVLVCQIRNVKSHLPCIIDEIKPLFGISKLGTHDLYIGKTMYQIIKARVPSLTGGLQEDHRLDEMLEIYKKMENLPDYVKREVQKIYIFRNIMGIPQNFDRSIRVRISNNLMTPLSFTESKMDPQFHKAMSKTCIRKWFDNDESIIKELLNEMLQTKTDEDVEYKIPLIRGEMDNIFSRINKDATMYKTFIIRNLQNKIGSFV